MKEREGGQDLGVKRDVERAGVKRDRKRARDRDRLS